MKTVEDIEIEELAEELHHQYCLAVGGVAFNGDPLPNWREFSSDPQKAKQSDGWRAVAFTAINSLVHGGKL